jgi:hypothetical protein
MILLKFISTLAPVTADDDRRDEEGKIIRTGGDRQRIIRKRKGETDILYYLCDCFIVQGIPVLLKSTCTLFL